MNDLRIGVIGAGSSYTPELIDGLIRRKDELAVGRIALMDIDPDRLAITGGLAGRMLAHAGLGWRLDLTTDLAEALDGADFVITQIRQGGLEARAQDEKLPRRHGLIGQETTGPGGFAMALRTIPELLRIARLMERLSPAAMLINFTNPSGLITEAITRHSAIRTIGLCNVPITTKHTIASLLGVESDRLEVESFGLNHLSWVSGVALDGQDITESFFDRLLADPPEELCEGFNLALIRAMRLIPGGYLRYYYSRDRMLAKQAAETRTRAEEVMAIDAELMALYARADLHEKPAILEKRGGAWYSDAAISLVSAIANDRQETHIVNLPNEGSLPGLAADAVAEIPAVICGSGARPARTIEIPLSVLGLIQSAKAYELLTVKAAVSGSRDDALIALVNNPLVGDADRADALLDDILAVNRPWLPQFFS